MKVERTRNTILGVTWGVADKLVKLVLPFVSRTCIIYFLGANYVGLDSLFTSILSVLSLAELGFGSAVVYSMYRPVADGDYEKICALMKFYKNVYRIIGLIVFLLGLCVIPFLPSLIKADLPGNVNLYVLYFIYLGNSVVSYWLFAYKNCLLTATQRTDVISKVSTVVNLGVYVTQIVALLKFRDYLLYSGFIILSTVLNNVIIAWQVKKLYPSITCRCKLERNEIKSILKQVSGLMIQRLAYTSRNSFDSIIISVYLGLVVVGIYNNYFYVLNALTSILAILFTAMQGGLGNSVVKESTEKNYLDYCRINFLYMLIAGWCSCCLLSLYQPFMCLWVGENMTLPFSVVILFVLYFYVMKMTDTTGAYITVNGMWWRCKWSYIIEATLNLILNIVLGFFFGVTGVVIATIITVFAINYILNTYILFKYYFTEYNYLKHIFINIKYLLVTSCVGSILWWITMLLPSQGTKGVQFGYLILKMLMCILVPMCLYCIIYWRNREFRESMSWLKEKILSTRR